MSREIGSEVLLYKSKIAQFGLVTLMWETGSPSEQRRQWQQTRKVAEMLSIWGPFGSDSTYLRLRLAEPRLAGASATTTPLGCVRLVSIPGRNHFWSEFAM